jgi:GH24 family phage-related lysozyme (muramidase)
MINFPSQFSIGDENKPVIGSGLLQPSIKAQAEVRPLRLVPITGTAQASELSASSAPKLATPVADTTPTWFDEGYNYNAKNEGMIPKVYLDKAAKQPGLAQMKEDDRWYEYEPGKWAMKTAGTGYTTDINGKPWANEMIGKVVTNKEEDRQRYAKDAAVWDADMAKRFPNLWSSGSDKNKATLRSFHHNTGGAHFKDGSTSQLYKQMKEGNWDAISFNVRTWAWKRDSKGRILKDKNGKPISNNPLLESRRERDAERLDDGT